MKTSLFLFLPILAHGLITVDSPFKPQLAYTINLLSYYQFTFHLRVHYTDEVVKERTVDEMLRQLHFVSLSLYNYDKNISKLLPSDGMKHLDVIVVSEKRIIADFFKYKHPTNAKDIIILVVNNKPFLEVNSITWWATPSFKKVSNVLLVHLSRDFTELYRLCYYCTEQNKTMLIEVTQSQEVNVTKKYLRPKSFVNFRGYLMRVAFRKYYPYIFCKKNNLTNGDNLCLDADGSEYRMLKTFSRMLNFRFQLIEETNTTIIFNKLAKQHFDFAIGGLPVRWGRKEILYGDVIVIEKLVYAFLGKKSQSFSEGIIASVRIELFILVLLFLVLKIIGKKRLGLKRIGILIYPAFDQVIPIKMLYTKLQFKTILILGSWYVFFLFVNMYMKSEISANVMHPSKDKTTKLQELLDLNYKILARPGATQKVKLDLEQFVPELKYQNTDIVEHPVCENLDKTYQGKGIIINELSKIYHHNRMCELQRKHLVKVPVRMRYPLLAKVYHAWAFKLDTPFLNEFNVRLKYVTGAGLMSRWYEQILHKRTVYMAWKKVFEGEEPSNGKLEEFLKYFQFYLINIGASIACFISELICNAWLERRLKNTIRKIVSRWKC